MHGNGLLTVLTISVSAFLPSVETFRAFQYKDQEGLELVAKYWVVFGVWNSLEAAANLFHLTRLIPFYGLLKLLAFSCMYQYGHQLCFEILSPFVDEAEPMGQRMVKAAYYIAYEVQPFLTQAFNFVAIRVMTAIVRWQDEENQVVKKSAVRRTSLASIQSQSLARSTASQYSGDSDLGAGQNPNNAVLLLKGNYSQQQKAVTVKEAENTKSKEKQSCVII
uniref:Receptor expression-enhancing protein n=1 Tax=Ditylenchus dipsaci TaxID=166011 RepID=A0A915DXI5_9BILA